MKCNSSISLGGVLLIDRVEKQWGVFHELFSGVGGKAKDFVGCVKLHVYNKLTHAVSTHQILDTYPGELASYLGLELMPKERNLYRALERIGRNFPVLHSRFQELIRELGVVDEQQMLDFSSVYFEGSKAELGELGYSRDHRPDRPQVTFGIATGLNGIPTALTIQRGNVQDKKHMWELLTVVSKVIPENALLIFDTGGNTRANKQRIRDLDYHYLTLKAKKVGPYRKHIQYFTTQLEDGKAVHFRVNDHPYTCVTVRGEEETLYVYFSPELYHTQLQAKQRKFLRQKKKGDKLLKKRKTVKIPSERGWVELAPQLQRTLTEIDNPYVNGVEGFFILESSVNQEPEKILRLYKNRDKAEKFIRALKEGVELRPLRHWTTPAIIGIFFVSFLTNFLINLTHQLQKKPGTHATPNLKLLKKHLINLTLTTVYPQDTFKYTILSNISAPIQRLFDGFVWKYQDKTLQLRW